MGGVTPRLKPRFILFVFTRFISSVTLELAAAQNRPQEPVYAHISVIHRRSAVRLAPIAVSSATIAALTSKFNPKTGEAFERRAKSPATSRAALPSEIAIKPLARALLVDKKGKFKPIGGAI